MKVVVATHNKGKLAEFKELLADSKLELISWDEAGLGDFDVEENGSSCEENSKIKATVICEKCGLPAMADDTGLFVDALNGEPGIKAARYAGEHGNDAANRAKILSELKNIPFEKRTAKFVTVITLAYPDGKIIAARGECPGFISTVEKGERGFGYDSVFIPEGSDKTFAELSIEYKNSVSHRRRALAKLSELLEK